MYPYVSILYISVNNTNWEFTTLLILGSQVKIIIYKAKKIYKFLFPLDIPVKEEKEKN